MAGRQGQDSLLHGKPVVSITDSKHVLHPEPQQQPVAQVFT